MKIAIANLNRTTSADNLRELFQPFGTVSAASLVLDRATGRSRGLGHVEMPEPSCGEQAIAALDNTNFMSQRIVVHKVSG